MGVLTHVALFTWKSGTTDEQILELSAGLAALPGLIPEIKRYRFGPDAGLAEGNVDFGVVADFAPRPRGTGPTPPIPPTATSSTASSNPSGSSGPGSSSRAELS